MQIRQQISQVADARTRSLSHFLRLAKQGKHPGSSSGEKRAFRIAECLRANLSLFDDTAVQGLHDFIDEFLAGRLR